MRYYYIYLDGKQNGPLTLEELYDKVKSDTLVWYEGLSDWQRADKIEDLQNHFKSIPPPLPLPVNNLIQTPEQLDNEILPNYTYQRKNKSSIKRKVLFLLLGILLFAGIATFINYQNEQSNKNFELEMRLAEQERIAREAKIKELNEQLTIAYQNLEVAKQELNNASAFKFLRSQAKRHEDVTNAETTVRSWEQQIKALESEIRELNP